MTATEAAMIATFDQAKKIPQTDTGAGDSRNGNGQPEGPIKPRRPSRIANPTASVAIICTTTG